MCDKHVYICVHRLLNASSLASLVQCSGSDEVGRAVVGVAEVCT